MNIMEFLGDISTNVLKGRCDAPRVFFFAKTDSRQAGMVASSKDGWPPCFANSTVDSGDLFFLPIFHPKY
jgi:hypothetical protein